MTVTGDSLQYFTFVSFPTNFKATPLASLYLYQYKNILFGIAEWALDPWKFEVTPPNISVIRANVELGFSLIFKPQPK